MNLGYADKEAVLSVSEANKYVKMLMDNDALLSSISVRGEISNLKYHTSGHLYFTLKDEDAEIAAVMFRSSVSTMSFAAKNGMKVTAFGRISIYEKSGKCQMYVSAMLDDGKGDLQLEYERLLRKLTEEGLFDKERKKALPKYPECVGIITSPTGAAVRDMINVTGRRWPFAKLFIYPSLVQGAEAPASLCMALQCLDVLGECDVIIIGRGGGSIEDLWAFNDESVVRAVAACNTPIISAVGHETDFTLCDFAADCRAPTPSAAAEIAVPDKNEIKMRIDDAMSKVDRAFDHCFYIKKTRLDGLSKRLKLSSPEARVEKEKQMLMLKHRLMESAMDKIMSLNKDRFRQTVGRLEALSPLAVLKRGYSVVRKSGGEVVSSVGALDIGEKISIVMSDGSAEAEIMSLLQNQTKGEGQ